MARNITIELPDHIKINADIETTLTPLWSNYQLREANKEWLKHDDIEYFHQDMQTPLLDVDIVEIIIEEEVTIKVKCLNSHFYMLYVLGDPVLYFKNEEDLKIEIKQDHSTAGYCPQAEYYFTLKPGEYTLKYTSPSSQWLLDSGLSYKELKELFTMLANGHNEHEIVNPGLISEKEQTLLTRLRSEPHKSIMDLHNILHEIFEHLIYRLHQRLDNARRKIYPQERSLLEKIRQEIVDQVDLGNNPSVSALCKKYRKDQTELKNLHKDQYDQNIQEFITSIRMEKALGLILAGMCLTEVSDTINFSTYSLFNRAFKKYFGYPPGEALAKQKEEQERLEEEKRKKARKNRRNRKE